MLKWLAPTNERNDAMAKYTGSYDLRYSGREISRMLGLDPGTGPDLQDQVCDEPPLPTLQEMTSTAGETPAVADVGKPPVARHLIPPGDFSDANGAPRSNAAYRARRAKR